MATDGLTPELSDEDWERLIKRLRAGKGTPFIGSSSGFGGSLTRPALALRLHREFECPLPVTGNLAKVAQFVSTITDPLVPAERIGDWLSQLPAPALSDPGNGYRLAAELPFPVYVTTTMDDYLVQAMGSA